MANAKNKKIYSVSQITAIIKTSLETSLPPRMVVTGEIGSFKRHHSGHCYLTLKDENSALPCVMWRSRYKNVKFEPEDGMQVLAAGYIDVYTVGGKYQFYIDRLDPAGVGELQIAFEQMVKRLEKEGLFEDTHKKPLPRYPERIGIMTSESGAAMHDITESIYNRWAGAKLLLYPVAVQGKKAAAEIAEGLKYLNSQNERLKLDLIILGRGGGSLEDLWTFNEEIVARAIYSSRIPIVSAVGHEVDTTIADLVADKRASTPTRAGIAAVPDAADVIARLGQIEKRLNSFVNNTVESRREKIRTIQASSVFRNPLLTVHQRSQMLDELSSRMYIETGEFLKTIRSRLDVYTEKIMQIEPHRLMGAQKVELNNKINQLSSAIKNKIYNCKIQLTAQANRVESLNPKSVLKRGYSITRNKKSGELMRKSEDAKTGDLIITEFEGENFIESEVTKK
jgi:exodeoxyribonuclease VII large subunit